MNMKSALRTGLPPAALILLIGTGPADASSANTYQLGVFTGCQIADWHNEYSQSGGVSIGTLAWEFSSTAPFSTDTGMYQYYTSGTYVRAAARAGYGSIGAYAYKSNPSPLRPLPNMITWASRLCPNRLPCSFWGLAWQAWRDSVGKCSKRNCVEFFHEKGRALRSCLFIFRVCGILPWGLFQDHPDGLLQRRIEFFRAVHHQEMVRFLQHDCIIRKHVPPVCFITYRPHVAVD